MINFLSIIALGLFLGMRHATDPDHVIAVSTIVSRERQISKSAWIGVFWGLGHTITILAVGGAIILLDLVVRPAGIGTAHVNINPRVGLAMDFGVAVMLIVLGIMNLRRISRQIPLIAQDAILHSHAHAHGDYVHSHVHCHEPELHSHANDETPLARLDKVLLRFRTYNLVRALVMGIVHGLSGSAAVALLVVAIIPDPRWSVAYLLVFGVGTIFGMMVITFAIACAFHLVGGRQKFVLQVSAASGLLSLGFGLFFAYHIIVVNGLLGMHPQWVPR